MKKNYTLKIVLAMLFVVLVSLVSFVGVYKGKNVLKEYSLGKDFSDRKVVMLSVVEDTTNNTDQETTDETSEESDNQTTEESNEETTGESTEETNEETNNESEEATTEEKTEQTSEQEQNDNNSENDKTKQYKDSKNIIERRLAEIKSEEYDIRLDEATGALAIEVPSDFDSSYITNVVSSGKAQIKNQSTNEVIIEPNGFKSANARIDSTSYAKPIILLNIKFTKDAKNILKNINTNYTDSEGNESEATLSLTIDGESIYEDQATTFVNTAKNGSLELVYGQDDDTEAIEEKYQRALSIVSLINNGEISTKYQVDSIKIVSSNINIKTIIIIVSVIGLLMLAYSIYKFKKKGILPVLSLVGLVATILLVLRYTNVKLTLFSILGIAVIVVANYIFILRNLSNDKSFKDNFMQMINMLVPCLIIAVVFCCSPYLQLATMGMSIFWGVIVMVIYNVIITRILIDK